MISTAPLNINMAKKLINMQHKYNPNQPYHKKKQLIILLSANLHANACTRKMMQIYAYVQNMKQILMFCKQKKLPLPSGVISATSSSTVTASSPFLRMISLQYSFSWSLQPQSINCCRKFSFSLSFSPLSTSFAMMLSRIWSSLFCRSSAVSAIVYNIK